MNRRHGSHAAGCPAPAGRKTARRRRKPWALLALPALALFASAAVLGQQAEEPTLSPRLQAALEKDRLQRELELVELRNRLREAQDRQQSLDIGALRELLARLQTEEAIEALLKKAPGLRPLYERLDGARAASERRVLSGCNCLEHARLHWLGRNGQSGQAIVSLNRNYYEVLMGGRNEPQARVGESGCRLVSVGEREATLTCRVDGAKARRATLALQRIPEEAAWQ